MNYLSLTSAAKVVDWARTLVTQLTQRDAAFGTLSAQNANDVNITGGRVTTTSPLTANVAAGVSALDQSGQSFSLANGGTVDFTSFSGMVLANDFTAGPLTLYLVGGGNVAVVASAGTQVGTMTFTGSAYRFTNTSGATRTFSLTAIRTRAFT